MKERKIKTKFNLIDILIILVLVVVLGVFASYANIQSISKGKTNAKQTVPVQYTVEVKGIREDKVGVFTEGEDIYGGKNTPIAKIVSIGEYEHEKAVTEDETKDKYVLAEIPNRYTVKLVIEAPCVEGDVDRKVDGNYIIKIGKNFNIKTDKYVTGSTILEIKED